MKTMMFLAVLTTAAISTTGCTPQATPPSAQAPQRVASGPTSGYVIVQDTPYFKNGPAQPMPADGTLRGGTYVIVGKKIGSYTLVHTADGVAGYVKTSDIAAVPTR
jgi:hypothetical protein